ncbi:MAG: hypothetical protein ACI9A7_002283 [Cyclobacteriaceae bacterium]|jgi:hypothetical protein
MDFKFVKEHKKGFLDFIQETLFYRNLFKFSIYSSISG